MAGIFSTMSLTSLLTLFGGTMAIADLGVMETWWGLGSDFSPLTERRNICDGGSAISEVCFEFYLCVTTATYVHHQIATGGRKTGLVDGCPCGTRLHTVDSRSLAGILAGLSFREYLSGCKVRSMDSVSKRQRLRGSVAVCSRFSTVWAQSASGSQRLWWLGCRASV